MSQNAPKIRWNEPIRDLIDITRNIWPFSSNSPVLSNFTPAADIYEQNGVVHMDVELPGVKKEDISVTLNNGILTLAGETRHIQEVKEEGYVRSERRYGKWSRSINISDEVEPHEIQAEYTEGILKVSFPKKGTEKAAEAHKINIK